MLDFAMVVDHGQQSSHSIYNVDWLILSRYCISDEVWKFYLKASKKVGVITLLTAYIVLEDKEGSNGFSC